MINAIALLVVAAAGFAYLNERITRLPMTIGVAAIALACSLAFMVCDGLQLANLRDPVSRWLSALDFSQLLLQGMLSFLLFAGAFHVDGRRLRQYAWQIGFLAVVATAASAFLIGVATHWVLRAASVSLPLSYCLVFGALIAPTDAVAVLGALRRAKVPGNVETAIAGESLFNDGVGIVLFTIFAQLATSPGMPSTWSVVADFSRQAFGGLLLGGAVGGATFLLMRRIDRYQVEVLLTLAAVVGGYAVAANIGVSGPLAMVVAGVLLGNEGREQAMSATTRDNIDTFWELIDVALNAILFTLIGLEAVSVHAETRAWIAIPATVLIVLVARILTVGAPVALVSAAFRLPAKTAPLLVWAGLRGGISIALALSLPSGHARDIVLMLTYGNVIFSTFSQGLTIGWLAKRTQKHLQGR
ncbi:cation:proton antiporter [Cupriavidus basilensis]|uniref:Sodium:proton antiporter n=1 Tax=Cupriavidus basilensis TaxID=68895 RepID=A0A643FZW2_9BURK|nr:sodium:proton antiporter [Cupriavidus basilensis]QOT80329.1 sodium:proton antiporter [Cupriavidus basilensis]